MGIKEIRAFEQGCLLQMELEFHSAMVIMKMVWLIQDLGISAGIKTSVNTTRYPHEYSLFRDK